MEAIILQISATLVKGKARICFNGNRVSQFMPHKHSNISNVTHTFLQGQYSLARAQQSFRSLVQIHEKSGTFTSGVVPLGGVTLSD